MPGPGIVLVFIIVFIVFLLMVVFLVMAIVNAIRIRKIKLPGFLFLGMALVAGLVYFQYTDSKYQSSKKFRGVYKLQRLDGHLCDSCTVSIKRGYEYDIIVNNKLAGHGKWHMAGIMEQDIELPYPVLKLENGPEILNWDTSRIIFNIDRRK